MSGLTQNHEPLDDYTYAVQFVDLSAATDELKTVPAERYSESEVFFG